MDDRSPSRGRRVCRRLLKVGLMLTFLSIITVLAVPTLLSTAPGCRLILRLANGALAPTRVEIASVRLSWLKPTLVTGLMMRDPAGKAIVSAPRATLDRSVWQLLTDRPRYGTLTLHGAAVDIERKPDGSIDLATALDPILGGDESDPGDPASDFTLRVVAGTLRLSSSELTETLAAARLDMTLRAPAAPDPIGWEIRLANPPAAGESDEDAGEALTIRGDYDHRAGGNTTPDLTLIVEGARWPAHVAVAGVAGSGRLDGRVGLRCQGGRWATKGAARLLELDATGRSLRGDRLQIDRLDATWDVADAGASSWAVRRLDLACPLAELAVEGVLALTTDAAATIEGQVDLAALARQLPRALHLREGLVFERGVIHGKGAIRPDAAGQHLEFAARATDLAARLDGRALTWDEPATLDVRLLRTAADAVLIERIAARTAFLDASVTGDLKRGVNLSATIDLGGLGERLAQWIGLGGIEPGGQVRLEGRYAAPGGTFRGSLAAEVRDLVVTGLTSEPIRRPATRLDATIGGPAGADGVPTGWSDVAVKLDGPDERLDLTAVRDDDGATEVRGHLAAPVTYDGRGGRVEARLAGRHRGPIVEIDEARVALTPDGPAAQAGAVALAARGRYDGDAGTLALEPPPVDAGAPADALRLLGTGLAVSGLGDGAAPIEVRGQLGGDLLAVDRAIAYWTGAVPVGVGGSTTVGVTARRARDGVLQYALRVGSADLARNTGGRWQPEGTLSVQSRGVYRPDGDRLDLTEFAVVSRYGSLKAAGLLAELTTRRVADLQGTLDPSWELVNALAAASIEPGARVRGAMRPFNVRGPLSGASTAEILRGLDAELGLDLAEAAAFGVVVGPAPIALRCAGGQATIAPISTTVNGGRLELRPELVLDDPAGIIFRLAPGSTIREAEINEEVSERVLSYLAPVLHQATQVGGKLSVDFDRAEIPIAGAAGRSAAVAGKMAFQGVTYGPGPLARQLLGLVGESQVPELRLDRTIAFRVADGRVGQEGLAIDVGREVQIALDGSVGFDGTLALRAGVPITAAMVGGAEGLPGQLVGGTRVGVPIGGTFASPRLDRGALQVGLREAGGSLIRRGAQVGATELFNRLAPAPEAGLGPEGTAPAQPGPALERLPQEALRRFLPQPGAGDRTTPR